MKLALAAEAPALAVDILGELGFADLRFHKWGKSGDPPPALRSMLPESDGFVEHSSEHTVLGHERALGLRRGFRLLIGEHRRALVSQLIAFDRDGRAHLTDIVGDVERLEFREDRLIAAQVLHLDRASGELREVETLDRIPSHGATFSIIDFSPPVRVDDLPCLRCHDDRQMMSLPVLGEDPTERLRRVAASAVLPAR